MSILDTDCSLDLSEAIDFLLLLHVAAESADNAQGWHTLRQPVMTTINTVEQIIRRSLPMA